MNQFLGDHLTKILGVVTALLGGVQSMVAAKAFEGLLEPKTLRWVDIICALSLIVVGAGTTARGFSNTTRERIAESGAKVAEAMETAIKSTPPAVWALFAVLFLVGCTTTPKAVIEVACDRGENYDVVRCAKSLPETYEVYQKRAEEIVADAAVPEEVKAGVRKAEATSTAVMVQVLRSARLYTEAREQLRAGTTEAEKVAIANQNLEVWVARAIPVIRDFGKAVGVK